MEREGAHGRWRGFFVAFGYTRDAEQECAAFHDSTELVEVKRTGRIIKLLTVQEILGRGARAQDVNNGSTLSGRRGANHAFILRDRSAGPVHSSGWLSAGHCRQSLFQPLVHVAEQSELRMITEA